MKDYTSDESLINISKLCDSDKLQETKNTFKSEKNRKCYEKVNSIKTLIKNYDSKIN